MPRGGPGAAHCSVRPSKELGWEAKVRSSTFPGAGLGVLPLLQQGRE